MLHRLTRLFRIFLHEKDVTYSRLKESIQIVGTNPHQCLNSSRSGCRFDKEKNAITT
jgi:hypothetical protein